MRAIIRSVIAMLVLVGCQADRAASGTDAMLPRPSYASVRIEDVADLTGAQLGGQVLDAIRDEIGDTLSAAGFDLAGWTRAPAPVVLLKSEILSCEPLHRRGRPMPGAQAVWRRSPRSTSRPLMSSWNPH